MKKLNPATSFIGLMTLLSPTAHAGSIPSVPEINGGMTAIAIGLTLGIVALIREHRRKKYPPQ